MSQFPGDIPKQAPLDPSRHPDRDLDIIIKLQEVIHTFLERYITNYLSTLIHEGLEDLKPYFQSMLPVLSQNSNTVIIILTGQQPTVYTYPELKSRLGNVALTAENLEFKDRSIRAHINRFFRYVRSGINKTLQIIAKPVFKVINSFLGSLKEAVTLLPMVGAAIEVIGQIKDHLEAASVE